jgi:large subunit ribosomal protein L22
MEAKAILRSCTVAPRKMQLVADLVRGRGVYLALNLLKYQPKAGAIFIEKLLKSAIANWQVKYPDADSESSDLYISQIFVTQGKTLKRFQPAPQGRAHRIRKRSNHVTLVVSARSQSSIAELAQSVETVETQN